MNIFVFTKTPESLLNYTVDWSEWLAGDTIMDSDWEIPDGITNVNDVFDSTSSTIWVNGGTKDNSYTLVNTITTTNGLTDKRYIVIKIVGFSNIDYLIPELRLQLGDINESSYRYIDEWLSSALLMSVKSLTRWWKFKYIVEDKTVSRNSNCRTFTSEEPPVIDIMDERAIIIMAAIVIMEGSLENAAWNFVSWRDAEIAYSNLESSRAKDANLKRLWDELMSITTPPTKRLARTVKGDLPGYKPVEGNKFEIGNMD